MDKVSIKVPAVGESITEATIASWNKKNGEYVNRDEVLLSLETDKASVEVVAEHSGVIQLLAKEGDVVKVGAEIGRIDTTAKSAGTSSTNTTTHPNSSANSGVTNPRSSETKSSEVKSTGSAPTKSSDGDKSNLFSPAVRRAVHEFNVDPKTVIGTGREGRLTKGDVLEAVQGAGATVSSSPVMAPPATPSSPIQAPVSAKKPLQNGNATQRVPMTTIRKRIAERLVQAQHTAAILTTFNEIDMSKVSQIRNQYKDKFKEKYNVSLGFMGFFVKAVIEGLKAFPKVNAFIDGQDIIYNNHYHIGIAVGTEKGLLVPVLRHADQMSLFEIELAIKNFALKARDGKISVDDLSGGTFTISNGGVYGSLMSTPILNPPQSGILGMHKIEERPVVVGGQIVVRPMMYVALSYDHRMIDGGESVSFLVRVKDCIEDPTRVLLEI